MRGSQLDVPAALPLEGEHGYQSGRRLAQPQIPCGRLGEEKKKSVSYSHWESNCDLYIKIFDRLS